MRDRRYVVRLGSLASAGTRSDVRWYGTQSTQHHQQFLRRWQRGCLPFGRVQRPHRSYFQQWLVNTGQEGEGNGNRLGLEHDRRRSRPLLRGRCQQRLVGFHQDDSAHEGWSAEIVGHLQASHWQPGGSSRAIPLPWRRILVHRRPIQRSRRPDLCCAVMG